MSMKEACIKCGKQNFLSLYSAAYDQNYYQCNNQLHRGPWHMPKFSTLTRERGCSFTICLECGWIVGLDLTQLKKDVEKAYSKKEEEY